MRREERPGACGDGGRSTLRWSHGDQRLRLPQCHNLPLADIFGCGVCRGKGGGIRRRRTEASTQAEVRSSNCKQHLSGGPRVWGSVHGRLFRAASGGVGGMAGGLHLSTGANRAWLPGAGAAAGSEFLTLEVGGKLQSLLWRVSDGFDRGKRSRECVGARIGRRCCRDYGAKFVMPLIRAPGGRVTSPGNRALRFVSASMAGSCTDAPSCIFVGPIETAEKARLEALYQQARDSYYSGRPLVVDDMFDKVEMQLRWHGSKLVLKYPRCSLKRFTAYADAEVDPSQMRALKAIWSLIFAVGLSLAVGLPALVSTYMEFNPHEPGTFVMSDTNRAFLSVVSFLVGAPVAQAAVKQLQALGRGDLVALKGCCPNCGEEVYTFVKPDHSSLKARHESECHICERQLVFQATLHPSKSGLGQPWAHGRVYLQTRANQLAPARRTS